MCGTGEYAERAADVARETFFTIAISSKNSTSVQLYYAATHHRLHTATASVIAVNYARYFYKSLL